MATELVSQKSGILPTPPLPADLPPVDLTDNARQVLVRRYVGGATMASPQRAWKKCSGAWPTTSPKSKQVGTSDVIQRAREFYALLTTKKFFPNSPTFTGAGTPLGQLAACFVLPISR
jgi:ribonucleoside-diphosphate reductase alpha chain